MYIVREVTEYGDPKVRGIFNELCDARTLAMVLSAGFNDREGAFCTYTYPMAIYKMTEGLIETFEHGLMLETDNEEPNTDSAD